MPRLKGDLRTEKSGSTWMMSGVQKLMGKGHGKK
jgi:hypothetical protein